jgi:hypothetical protein
LSSSKTPVRTVYSRSHEYRVIKAAYDNDNARQSYELQEPRLLAGPGLVPDEQVGGVLA